MPRLTVGALPEPALAAAAAFHAEVLPRVAAALAAAAGPLVLVFAPADHSHLGWRLAAIQGLASEHAPRRINAVAQPDSQAPDAQATAAACAYLDAAEGVTGQYLPLDSQGAGAVIRSVS